jgi:single-strand DNA-binding protein
MMWMNVACLVGRATAEPKARETAGGTKYATLRLAVPRGRGETDFFTIELWGKLATVAHAHVAKGTVVTLRCELKQQAWSAEGQRRERLVLVARSLGVVRGVPEELDADESGIDDSETEVAA